MYSTASIFLLAVFGYPDGTQAAEGRLSRRQSSAPVALWGACNYPSQGINGPLPCVSGSECICKDDSMCNLLIFSYKIGCCSISSNSWLMSGIAYSQCREQLGGAWAPDSSWQCQQPGDTATSSSTTTPSPSSDTLSESNTGSAAVDTSDTNSASSDTPSDSSSSQAATLGDCISTSAPGDWDGVASTSVSLQRSSFGLKILRWP